MGWKDSINKCVKKFYYSPDSHYCAIIAKDREAITHAREAILTHYLGECHDVYKQKQFIATGKSRGLAGQLIHMKKESIANKLIGENKYEGVVIELNPINFDSKYEKKSGLQRLINLNS